MCYLIKPLQIYVFFQKSGYLRQPISFDTKGSHFRFQKVSKMLFGHQKPMIRRQSYNNKIGILA